MCLLHIRLASSTTRACWWRWIGVAVQDWHQAQGHGHGDGGDDHDHDGYSNADRKGTWRWWRAIVDCCARCLLQTLETELRHNIKERNRDRGRKRGWAGCGKICWRIPHVPDNEVTRASNKTKKGAKQNAPTGSFRFDKKSSSYKKVLVGQPHL